MRIQTNQRRSLCNSRKRHIPETVEQQRTVREVQEQPEALRTDRERVVTVVLREYNGSTTGTSTGSGTSTGTGSGTTGSTGTTGNGTSTGDTSTGTGGESTGGEGTTE